MALFCCTRLGNRSVLASLNRFPSVLSNVNYTAASASMPKMVIKKYEQPKLENFESKNERLKRPMSPHLTVYAIQLTSTLSITHRATGMILSTYMAALGVGAFILPHDISHYISIIEGMNLSPATIFIAKVILASPFGYHFANGMRHLYWDTAKGLSLKEVYATGYAMLGLAVIITLGLASL